MGGCCTSDEYYGPPPSADSPMKKSGENQKSPTESITASRMETIVAFTPSSTPSTTSRQTKSSLSNVVSPSPIKPLTSTSHAPSPLVPSNTSSAVVTLRPTARTTVMTHALTIPVTVVEVPATSNSSPPPPLTVVATPTSIPTPVTVFSPTGLASTETPVSSITAPIAPPGETALSEKQTISGQTDTSAKQKLDEATSRVLQLKKAGAPLVLIQAATEEYKATRALYEAEAAKIVPPSSPTGRRLAEHSSGGAPTAKQRMDAASVAVTKLKREQGSLEEIRIAVETYKAARAEYEAEMKKLET